MLERGKEQYHDNISFHIQPLVQTEESTSIYNTYINSRAFNNKTLHILKYKNSKGYTYNS